MKNAVGRVGIVVAYSLLEVGLLFSLMLITSSYSASATYQASVFWRQMLLIPGSAALMSRIVYGPHGWARRALNILVVGALGVPILFLILIAVLSLLDWVSSVTWTSTSPIVFFAAVALPEAGVITAVVLVIKKGVRYSLRLEAARWLDERHAESNRVQSRWRRRAIHHAPWVPATPLWQAVWLASFDPRYLDHSQSQRSAQNWRVVARGLGRPWHRFRPHALPAGRCAAFPLGHWGCTVRLARRSE